MKITRKFLGTLTLMGCMVIMAGCRPTIEFQADSSTASQGDTVTLDWEVELAKGTTSSKVTITDLGEVEVAGSGEVVVNETSDFQIRVSTFVLGMPITAKESLTITVPEDNFETYDFEGGSDEGWEEDYAFYRPEYNYSPDNNLGVLCADSTTSSSNPLVVSPPEELDLSLKFCTDNDADRSDEERYSLAFVQKRITDDQNFEIERGKTYQVGYEVTYGIRFSEQTCDDIEERLSEGKDDDVPILSNLRFVIGAATDPVQVREDDDIEKLELENFITDAEAEAVGERLTEDDDFAVNGPAFETILDQNGAQALKFSDSVLKLQTDGDLNEEIKDLGCPGGVPTIIKDVFRGITTEGFVQQIANEDRELHLFFGLLNKTDENEIEFYIDTIKVQIQEL